VPVAELCREHAMSNASFSKWRAKYGGMDASLISQMKAMEDENRRLKRMYADLSMQADLLKEAPDRVTPSRKTPDASTGAIRTSPFHGVTLSTNGRDLMRLHDGMRGHRSPAWR
jgi:putative transposase